MSNSNPTPRSRTSSQSPNSDERSIAQAGYLRPEDVTEDRLLRIANWQIECASTDGYMLFRAVLAFENEEKALVLGSANTERLSRHFGRTNFKHWVGHLVQLSVVTTPDGPAIRLDAATDSTQHGGMEFFQLN